MKSYHRQIERVLRQMSAAQVQAEGADFPEDHETLYLAEESRTCCIGPFDAGKSKPEMRPYMAKVETETMTASVIHPIPSDVSCGLRSERWNKRHVVKGSPDSEELPEREIRRCFSDGTNIGAASMSALTSEPESQGKAPAKVNMALSMRELQRTSEAGGELHRIPEEGISSARQNHPFVMPRGQYRQGTPASTPVTMSSKTRKKDRDSAPSSHACHQPHKPAPKQRLKLSSGALFYSNVVAQEAARSQENSQNSGLREGGAGPRF